MKKRIADIVMEVLIENGITDCFSVVGGGAMHLNNALALCDNINKVFNHHEQACAMAAEAYARACGKIAAVCVTSGPGGTNTLTGVEGAWVDSIPMLIISGQVRYETSVAFTGLPLRSRGVQEFDIISSVKNMTKYAKQIINPLEVRCELQKAIDIAMSGRRGPVWIDIPLDVQSALVEVEDLLPKTKMEVVINESISIDIDELVNRINKAKRPCILTGSGIRTSNTVEIFREVITKLKTPIVGGALQADILYNGFPYYYGMSGNIGPRTGNFILQNSDVIVVLGNSLSFKQTGFNQKDFAPNAKIIMIDIDENEKKKPGLKIDYFIHSDLHDFFGKLHNMELDLEEKQEWIMYCDKLKNRFSLYESIGQINEADRVKSTNFWKKFDEKITDDYVIALGNSTCICGKLQYGINKPSQRVLVNYNCGSMGDDLPEAIGAAIALKQEVYCVTGDGSIMMNLQELQTIVHYNLPIKVIIFSNNGYGAIRQTCKNFFNGKYIGCDEQSGVSMPNFEKVSKAFGIPYYKCSSNGELEKSLDIIRDHDGYLILEIIQELVDPVEPKVMSRMNEDKTFSTPALHDMYPFIEKEEIDKLMFTDLREDYKC